MLIISLPSGAAAPPPYEFRGNARERGRRSVGPRLLEIHTRPPGLPLQLFSSGTWDGCPRVRSFCRDNSCKARASCFDPRRALDLPGAEQRDPPPLL